MVQICEMFLESWYHLYLCLQATAEQVRTALENLTAQGMITIQNSDSANMEKSEYAASFFHYIFCIVRKYHQLGNEILVYILKLDWWN